LAFKVSTAFDLWALLIVGLDTRKIELDEFSEVNVPLSKAKLMQRYCGSEIGSRGLSACGNHQR